MQPFLSHSRRSAWSSAALPLALAAAFLASACGGSSAGSGQSGITGEEATKPGGGLFFVDANQSGGGTSLHISRVLWGRLVDIHEVDALGDRVETPVFRDFLVEQEIGTFTSQSYVLDRNPVTQRERLTIRAQKTGVLDTSAFDQLLAEAVDDLPVISAKNDNGTSSPPFTTVPRNGSIALVFDDCLDDDFDAERDLISTVQVRTGYPPVVPFQARVVFDQNHGAIVGSTFHTTRVLVDMTVSEEEQASLPNPLAVNAVGLPARVATTASTNASIHVPSVVDVGTGQFAILRNLSQKPLDPGSNGPADLSVPSQDVVRAFKSGNSSDTSNGFLIDTIKPRLVSGWPMTVTSSENDLAGVSGLDFVIDFTFPTTCAASPVAGDVVRIGAFFLEVTTPGTLVGSDVFDLGVRSVSAVPNPLLLLGDGLFQTPFLSSIAVDNACWVSFLPDAITPPSTGVTTTANVVVRFSEPMDPETLSPFRDFMVVKGIAGGTSGARASTIVIGDLLSNPNLTEFSFDPHSPYPHSVSVADPFHLELTGARDLAGNSLRNALPFVNFTIDSSQPVERNGSVVLRFEAADEYAPNNGAPDSLRDLRGQFNLNTERGSVTPRTVAYSGWPVDNNNPVPMLMLPVATGVFTPLNPLGAKLQTVWRYADMGWAVRDETKYNLDVVGINWSPVGGLAVADFYDRFEMRLGHSRLLPDEVCCQGGLGGTSGLPGTPNLFSLNYLTGTETIVHNQVLGYTVNPATLFNSTSGTPLIPYPLNRTPTPQSTYTWRDTTILGRGANGDQQQKGVPMEVEFAAGLISMSGIGSVAGPGNVPTIGLPLLIEIRCHPSNQGLGLNRFAVNITNGTAPTPGFRAYSAGGINTLGNSVIVQPDSETFPQGGFNALSNPPGIRTATSADNVFYLGQLDTVVRVSRVHTVWLDSGVPGAGGVLWQDPVLEPPRTQQPLGTDIQISYRGATSFNGGSSAPFDADAMDAYGETTTSVNGQTDWGSQISVASGKRYIQLRLTFVNNTISGVSPELKGLGLPFNQ